MHNTHKLNSSMHKASLLRTNEKKIESESVEPEADVEHQDRLVKVLTLHSKGFS